MRNVLIAIVLVAAAGLFLLAAVTGAGIAVLEAIVILVAAAIFIFGVALVIDYFRTAAGPCGLVTRVVFRDTCEGTCPAGQICTVATPKPYGPGFLKLAPQAATCACAVAPGGGAPVPGPGPGGGTPAPGSGSGGGTSAPGSGSEEGGG